jgi:Zn-dependent alcohol dehydrogenase
LQQAETIIAIDTLDEKLAMAQSFGATHTLNAAVEDPIKAVRALTGGAGVDYAFATVGSVQAIEGAFKMLRRGGTLVVVGLPQVTAKIELRVHSLVAAERRVLGSFMGSTRLHEDVPRLVEYYQQGRLKLDELISDCYPLERINEAIAAMEAGSALRNLIVFS